MISDPVALLRTGAERLALELSPETQVLLGRYFDELCKWNRRMNLVAMAPAAEIIDKHFLDSLTLLPLLRRQPAAELLDVGTGAGFPGMVLKAAIPELRVTLVEPRQKRAAFLRHVIRTLALQEVEVVAARLTENGETPLPLSAYALITSRALSEMAPFLTLAAPYCAPGGRVVCMKGSRGPAEYEEWQKSNGQGFRLIETQEWRLPFSDACRFLFIFQRI
jgi:16S rRNA (guanine527-N7)-methyltransferase